MLNIKGYIGPIGDDLPSLVPLLIALTVFFAAFASTLQIFGERNAGFDADLGVLQIVRVLRSDNFITGYEEFQELCGNVTTKQFNYVAGITELDTGRFPGEFFDPFDYQFTETTDPDNGNTVSYLCTNVSQSSSILTGDNIEDFDVLVRTYPIALEEERIVRPAHLVVIAWN